METMIPWVLAVIAATSAAVCGDVIVVPDDFPTIQGAVDAAVDGDEIQIKAGTYMETIDLQGKGLALIGLSGSGVTIVDGDGEGSVVTAFSCVSSVELRGLTIRGGGGPDAWGGGVFVSSSTLDVVSCHITDNTSRSLGGGIRALSSILSLTGSVISGNQAGEKGEWYGGGLSVDDSQVQITDSTFDSNVAFVGGATYANECSLLQMDRTVFLDHDLTSEAGSGGGLHARQVDSVVLQECLFVENVAHMGGGAYFGGCPSVIVDSSTFRNNSGSYSGPLMAASSHVIVMNSLIHANSGAVTGGAIRSVNGTLILASVTIAGNTSQDRGAGVRVEGSSVLQIENSILWGNRSDAGFTLDAQYWYDASATVSISTSCIQGAELDPVTGVINMDPMFVDPLGEDLIPWTGDEDFHCLPMSPCVDQGNDSLVRSQTDIGGGDRIVDDPFVPNGAFGVTDMGAFEWEPEDLSPWNIRLLNVPDGGESDWWMNPSIWLPQEVPNDLSWVFWNIDGDHAVDHKGVSDVRRFVGEKGHLTLRLHGGSLKVRAPGDWLPSVSIGTWKRSEACELTIVNGTLIAETIRVDHAGDGALHVRQAATIEADQLIIAGGQVDGAGVIAAQVRNYGVVFPIGGSGPATLTCTKGYEQSSLESSGGPQAGMLRIPVAVADVGHLQIEGTATLGGTLWMDAPEGLELEEGAVFAILSATEIEGSFECIYSTGLTDDLFFIMQDASQQGNRQVVTVEVVSVSGLLGFGGAESTSFSGSVADAILHDMDVDGDLDIVLSLPIEEGVGSVIVLLNGGDNGSGGWTGFVDAGVQVFVGGGPAGLATADFNLDGLPDLAVANSLDDTISVLIQDDSGSAMAFVRTDLATDAHHGTPGDAIPVDVAAAQFIAGGGPDLAIANIGDGTVIFYESLWGSANATGFELAGEPLLPPSPPSGIDPTDVDDDKGVAGCAVLSAPGGSESTNTDPLLLSGGEVWKEYPVGSLPVDHVFGDLDSDGLTDIVVANFGEDFLSVLLGRAGDTYSPSFEVPIGDSPRSVTLGDLDGDGDLDVAAIVSVEGVALVRTLRNETVEGGPLILVPNSDEGSGESPMIVLGGDVDGDAVDDLVTVTEGSGSTSEEGPAVTTRRAVVVNPCPADLDGDGSVGIHDLLIVIDLWGTADADADLDGNGQVGITDILVVIDSWGGCDA